MQLEVGWLALDAKSPQPDAGTAEEASAWPKEVRSFGELDVRPAKEASGWPGDDLVFVKLDVIFIENKGFPAKEASVYAKPEWYLVGHESVYANPVL